MCELNQAPLLGGNFNPSGAVQDVYYWFHFYSIIIFCSYNNALDGLKNPTNILRHWSIDCLINKYELHLQMLHLITFKK